MPIFKNHHGQFHTTNTALVALTSLYITGAAVALSSPYWALSYPVLAPLVVFAATPLGIGILATVAIALIGLAVYAISKNNEISEEKASKVTQDGLLVRRDVYGEMKEDNQVKDEQGNVKQGQYYIGFNLGDKSYRVVVGDKPTKELGNTLLFKIDSLEVKNDKGEYVSTSNKPSEELGLNKEGAKEVNTYLGKLLSVTSAGQGQGQKQ
ncbi:hypothetical protein [Wolbachia endosymbiont of Mansonella perstans]|uniref:hypothetical protein n=1 Tax=Wolbachia endosymbiont of Mansonella perstans TaxID=229526 RepID=UPI001CE151FD|nr:hypothetical protein [Wolbachia endosymbiont of Mansonella perstans]MCA4774214.1 hypothetical protein [Wolbachia endosymbiont of Mansonella perstans]